MLTIGSLFSGIGGLELGLEWAGHGPVLWQVEQDAFCRRVLEWHWPGVERFADVRDVGRPGALARVDLICGGFPCQDISAAGSGAGLDGARSGLWWEFARVVGEVRPAWVVVENVASGAKRWVDAVRGELGRLGYETLPIPIAARDVGAPHRRGRVFIVAHASSEQLWEQSRRSSGARGTRSAEPPADGGTRSVADPVRERRPRGASIQEAARQTGRDAAEGSDSWWSAEPDVGRVAHGVPARVDRLRALGNAVVPQCAQVVGEVINLMRRS